MMRATRPQGAVRDRRQQGWRWVCGRRGAGEPGTLMGTFQKAAGAREKAANGDLANQGQVSHGGSGSGGRPGARAPLPWARTLPPQRTATSWRRQSQDLLRFPVAWLAGGLALL